MDYTTTTGTKSRWGAVDEAHVYPDMSAQRRQSPDLYHSAARERRGSHRASGRAPVAHHDCAGPGCLCLPGRSRAERQVHLHHRRRPAGFAPQAGPGAVQQLRAALPVPLPGDQEPIPAGEPFELVFSLLPDSRTDSRQETASASRWPLPTPATSTRRCSIRRRHSNFCVTLVTLRISNYPLCNIREL